MLGWVPQNNSLGSTHFDFCLENNLGWIAYNIPNKKQQFLFMPMYLETLFCSWLLAVQWLSGMELV